MDQAEFTLNVALNNILGLEELVKILLYFTVPPNQRWKHISTYVNFRTANLLHVSLCYFPVKKSPQEGSFLLRDSTTKGQNHLILIISKKVVLGRWVLNNRNLLVHHLMNGIVPYLSKIIQVPRLKSFINLLQQMIKRLKSQGKRGFACLTYKS